jgi:hypothetical protein
LLGGWKTLAMVQRFARLSTDRKLATLWRLIFDRTGTEGFGAGEAVAVGGVASCSDTLVPGAGVEPA